MEQQRPTVSLVLPTYNAAGHIERTFAEVQAFVARKGGTWEAVFVCDGCRDGSDHMLEKLAVDAGPLIRVLAYRRNRGKGYAVRMGMRRAFGVYRIFTDVDLAYPLEMAEAVADQLLTGQDVVVASRAHRESEIVASPQVKRYLRWRKVQSTAFTSLARYLVGIQQRDPQAGLKGMSARAVELVMPHVKCTGFGFDCDLLAACRYFGLHVREMPVRVIYDGTASTTRLSSSLTMARELWTIRQRWRTIRQHGLPEPVLPAVPTAVTDDVYTAADHSNEDTNPPQRDE